MSELGKPTIIPLVPYNIKVLHNKKPGVYIVLLFYLFIKHGKYMEEKNYLTYFRIEQ